MSNIGSYEERIKDFSWSIAEKELDYQPGNVINIGWYCTDRICQMGKANKKHWNHYVSPESNARYILSEFEMI